MDKTVTIYSTPVCHFCHLAKDFFAENNVEFVEHDVASDLERRKEMVDITGQMGVPVIQIGDEMIVGFNQPLITQLLGI